MAEFHEGERASQSNDASSKLRNGFRFRSTKLLAACLCCMVPMSAVLTSCSSDKDSSNQPSPQPQGDPSTENYITNAKPSAGFALVEGAAAATLVVSSADYAGVVRVAGDLQADIERVTQVKPTLANDAVPAGTKTAVIIGTVGKSALIDGLVSSGKLDAGWLKDGSKAKWETFLIQVVDNPMPGVDQALVIAGSDQRGTIYGVYDVSRKMGVSPWYFWDDNPPAHQSAVYVKSGRYSQGTPAVKFRGFFINDEKPSTVGWAIKTFGQGKAVIPRPSCTGPDKSSCTSSDNSYPNGLNHLYYEKVFEVALRLRANYFWPAVWSSQFGDDDPENLATVAKYGMVYGTSHEAPMVRGIEEWNKRVTAPKKDADGNLTNAGMDPWGGDGEWSFVRNPDSLKAYWREGVQRMKDVGFDAVVTMAMRGTNDFPSTDYAQGKTVMKDVLDSQKAILNDVFGEEKAKEIPKVWLLYKEVQTYWDADQGALRPPDDVTVVWCDDNWGNMRKLHDKNEPPRSGGYGVYYHFDYVGAGRNYKWIDTQLLPNTWEQLNLLYDYGVKQLWVVNVGDMKNEEVPLQFFLDYAWNPAALTSDKITAWEKQWATEQFGATQAEAIADVIHTYSTLQSDRKPELTNRRLWLDATNNIHQSDIEYFNSSMDPATRVYYDANPFSLTHYREMETVVGKWQALAAKVEQIKAALPAEKQDAFYELVYYEVKASANLYKIREAQFKNILYSAQGRLSTTDWGSKAQSLFDEQQGMSDYYNTALAGGKWVNWQTQPKLGYGDRDRYGSNAGWQQPQMTTNGDDNAIADALFPLVVNPAVAAATAPELGVTIDGAPMPFNNSGAISHWTTGTTPALPTFSKNQTQPAQYIELFSRGAGEIPFTIDAPAWLKVTTDPAVTTLGAANKEVRATFEVADWSKAADGVITVSGNGQTIEIPVKVDSAQAPATFKGFVESNGYVSMEADHYTRVVNKAPLTWTRIPDIGRTGSGMKAFPIDADAVTPAAGGDTPRLEYDVFVTNPSATEIKVLAYLSPRNNVRRNSHLAADAKSAASREGEGLRYAVSIDDAAPQVIDINIGNDDIFLNGTWERHTSDNVNLTSSTHAVAGPGAHTVKIWMVDPNVIVQKVVVDTGTGELAESYFGPPESLRLQ